MKKVSLLTLALLMMFVSVGCGKKVDDKAKNETTQTEAKAVADLAPNPADSLASKTFPIRNKDNTLVTIETDFGKMILELYHDVAPAHADSFVARTKDGFYKGLTFHRLVKNFMIQGGDPKGNGTGNAGYYLNAEFNELPHQDGTLSMARAQSPNSASCQFFICLARNSATQSLDKKYTVFGQLIKGYDVLHTIGSLPVEASAGGRGEVSKPLEEVVIRNIYVSDAEGNAL